MQNSIENWQKHWNENYRYKRLRSSFGSVLTERKYIMKLPDGRIAAMETKYIFFTKSDDRGENIVGLSYLGQDKIFERKEIDIHKYIIGWK